MKYLGDLNRIAGFTFKGTIYIDPRIATAETTLHEYTHLWAEVLRQRNPQEWQNIVQMMKETPEVWNYVIQNYPHLKTHDQIADEALDISAASTAIRSSKGSSMANRMPTPS